MKVVGRVFGLIGISLVVHALSAQFWGFRMDERHLFLSVITAVLFWEVSGYSKRYSLAIGLAVLLICGIAYPFLTEGPLRAEREQHAAETGVSTAN